MKWSEQPAGISGSWVRKRFVFHVLVDDADVELGWVREDLQTGLATYTRCSGGPPAMHDAASVREAKDLLIAQLVQERLDNV